MIDYLVWKKDWHASSSPVDLILPSRDCAASRELSQGRRGPRGAGRLPLRNGSSRKILPRLLGKEQTAGSKPRSRSRMKPPRGHPVWKNSMVMKSCKEDSVFVVLLGFFSSVLLLKIVRDSANPGKCTFMSSSIYCNAELFPVFVHLDVTACWAVRFR